MTNFGDAVRLFFANYANFSGRASRSMFWWVYLFNLLVSAACYVVGSVADSQTLQSLLSGAYGLAVLVPTLAIAVRRMHDIGKGGGWIFISLVPVIGWIWYIVLCCTDSEPFDNRFGPVPTASGIKNY